MKFSLVSTAVLGLAAAQLSRAAPLQQDVPAASDHDNVAAPVAVTDPDMDHWNDTAQMDPTNEVSPDQEDATTENPDDNGHTNSTEPPKQDDPTGNSTNTEPCAGACIPEIDVNASVIEGYQRYRAHVAVIGDYGTCKPGVAGNYTWTVDWGDKEQYIHKLEKIGPYQAERVYSSKKKRKVKVSFCAENPEGCDEGCSSFYKHIQIRP
jgi:hypothetical protein